MKKQNKKEKPEFIDDGRTIARMNVDGMPWYVERSGSNGQGSDNPDKEKLSMSKSGERALIVGVLLAALVAGLIIAAVFLVCILLFT